MKKKQNTNILLLPFLFIYKLIRYFFLGVKFVFFDAFYNIISYYVNKRKFNKLNNTNTPTITNDTNNNIPEEKAPKILSFNERQQINYEKQELIKEMQKEINTHKVSKDYYIYYGTKDGVKIKGTMYAKNKVTLHNFLANEGINVYQIKKAYFLNFFKKLGLSGNMN